MNTDQNNSYPKWDFTPGPRSTPAPGVDKLYDNYKRHEALFKKTSARLTHYAITTLPDHPSGPACALPLVRVKAEPGQLEKFIRVSRAIPYLLNRATTLDPDPQQVQAQVQNLVTYEYTFELAMSRVFTDPTWVRLGVSYAPPIHQQLYLLFKLPDELPILQLFQQHRALAILPGKPQEHRYPITVELEDDEEQLARSNKAAKLRMEVNRVFQEGLLEEELGELSTSSNLSLRLVLEFEQAKQTARRQWTHHRN